MHQGFLHIQTDTTGKYVGKDLAVALQNVQRWLHVTGYKRRKQSGNIVPNIHQTIKRHIYLLSFFLNRDCPQEERLREVYVDESYIHEHYHWNDNLLWDPKDNQDVHESKAKAKGRRYCFACAIQGPSPKAVEGQEEGDNRAG